MNYWLYGVIKKMKKQSVNQKQATPEKKVVGNYEKHPFFVKKNNAAKEVLVKVGLPDSYKSVVSKNHN